MTLVLASTSPRRQQLLTQLLLSSQQQNFTIVAPNIDESQQAGETPLALVTRLAIQKAQSGLELITEEIINPQVIGADTIVVHNNQVLGKPTSIIDARQMLQGLSACCHEVITAVAVTNGSQTYHKATRTMVTFCSLTEAQIIAYVDTGEPMDKAGSYGIQGIGGNFIREIKGSYSGVVGLPLVETRELLFQIGVI